MVNLLEKFTKKRKQNENALQLQRNQLKVQRLRECETLKVTHMAKTTKAEPPWQNLQLILSLQNKEIDLQKKIELSFNYVNSKEKGENGNEEACETVKLPRLVIFLSVWIQTQLIETQKRCKVDDEKSISGVFEPCLDSRCWSVFKFCLEESMKLGISLSFPRNILRAIQYVARTASSFHLKGSCSVFYNTVIDSLSLIFASSQGLSNDNLELWISTTCAVLELIGKTYDHKNEDEHTAIFSVKLGCSILEPFSKFLRVHPTRKKGFLDFVTQLLGPLISLLSSLRVRIGGRNNGLEKNLMVLIEDVLSLGIFHQTHIDGFLNLHSAKRYSTVSNGKLQSSKGMVKSYHRHLFDHLEKVLAEKKESTSTGVGVLLKLLVRRVKLQKSISNAAIACDLSAEKKGSLFDFFILLIEPILLKMNSFVQTKSEAGSMVLDLSFFTKSINSLLEVVHLENLYLKTEENYQESSFFFLQIIHNTVFASATELICLPTYDVDNHQQELIISLAKEQLVALQYLLDIEYKVMGTDSTSIWFVLLSYLAMYHCFQTVPDNSSLSSPSPKLGCQLVDLYSELRQVGKNVIGLCEVIRFVTTSNNGGDQRYGGYLSRTRITHSAYARAVLTLLCSMEFKHSISNGFKSIPEGQAGECVEQLNTDLRETIRWWKDSGSVVDEEKCKGSASKNCFFLSFNTQAELLGRGLSELYACIIDSLAATVGNSAALGRSISDLIAALRPSMGILVGLHPDSFNAFLVSLTSGTSNEMFAAEKASDVKFVTSTQWIIAFFFRLYVSCRTLYRQAISLMPLDLAKIMSAEMGDPFTANCGRDWVEKSHWRDEGYFHWITNPSASLLAVAGSISNIYLKERITDCSHLLWVLHAMVIQRLADLQRHIHCLDYALIKNESEIESKFLDEPGLSACHKRRRRWTRLLSAMRQEAVELVEFIMSYLELSENDTFSAGDKVLSNYSHLISGSCSENEKPLPSATWSFICENIDIWAIHACKKKLKAFVSLVISTSMTYKKPRGHHLDGRGLLNSDISVHKISSELLSDTNFHDHKFVCRYLPSRFCRLLEKSVILLFSSFSDVDVSLNKPLIWEDDLSTLNDSPIVGRGTTTTMMQEFFGGNSFSGCPFKVTEDVSEESTRMKFTACQNYLLLLCWIPKVCMNPKSLSLYTKYVVNLERLVLGLLLLGFKGALSSSTNFELLKLFLTCRKALKYIFVAFYEDHKGPAQPSLIPLLSDGSSCALWLLNSLSLVSIMEIQPSSLAVEATDISMSLMDYTSHIFLTFVKYECASALLPFKETNGWKWVLAIGGALKEKISSLLVSLRSNEDGDNGVKAVNLNSLTSSSSCFNGFLWGLVSALNQLTAITSVSLVKLLQEEIPQIKLWVNLYADFISVLMHVFFMENDCEEEDDAESDKIEDPNSASVTLNKQLLQSLVEGDGPEAASLLRQMLIGFSAILRLSSQTKQNSQSFNLWACFVEVSEILLLKFANMVGVPPFATFVWLDGVPKFLEELGAFFSPTSTSSSSNGTLYTKLIELHVNGLGKCISLQGKMATLASRSSMARSKSSFSHCSRLLDGLKVKLRSSFKALIRKPQELLYLSAMQSIERAMAGGCQGFTVVCERETGRDINGKISPAVAAAIDCLDLVFESVSGSRQLEVIRRHIQALVAPLFNIIFHLPSPSIFLSTCFDREKADSGPDSGAAILMCVDLLTRIAGKNTLFHMDSWQVAQCFRVPAAIFQDFSQFRVQEEDQKPDSITKSSSCSVDGEFTVDMFAACSRLLCSVLKHHQSHSDGCIPVLQESTRTLLYCLEMVDNALVINKGCFSWNIAEGVKCASSFRRIYEELRQHKDVFCHHCFKFLSDYIWIYSRCGPLKSGFKREVDAALKPGVYALIDACSGNDLQYLHSLFGEGPCRNTLKNLQHDYKVNFKYVGKV